MFNKQKSVEIMSKFCVNDLLCENGSLTKFLVDLDKVDTVSTETGTMFVNGILYNVGKENCEYMIRIMSKEYGIEESHEGVDEDTAWKIYNTIVDWKNGKYGVTTTLKEVLRKEGI